MKKKPEFKPPLIEDCGCGQDHEVMPMDSLYYGGPLVDLVCLEHKRHIPCRTCMALEDFYKPRGE